MGIYILFLMLAGNRRLLNPRQRTSLLSVTSLSICISSHCCHESEGKGDITPDGYQVTACLCCSLESVTFVASSVYSVLHSRGGDMSSFVEVAHCKCKEDLAFLAEPSYYVCAHEIHRENGPSKHKRKLRQRKVSKLVQGHNLKPEFKSFSIF